ncbi:hypothetical protein [Lentzea flava]|uniref:Uncharacterized protein n=1 Tax=Lentzea flava TaxID=103732 RepID=A0ABQ2UG64_9PSEU|nr:hypothetical protein [Lentzea flava]MCP2199026.1 hypothetical protein [Lentzea flava]GGU32185.1 hypothetical protein GCM10010178_25430 [Lentzea flava]
MRFDDLLARDVEELHQEVAAISSEATVMHALDGPGRVEMPQSTADEGGSWSRDWPASELSACRERAELGDARSARRLAELLEFTDQHTEAGAWWHRAAALGDQDAVAYLAEVGNRT